MKKLFAMLVCFFPLTAHCEVVSENFCFTSASSSAIEFELRTYFDNVSKWSGAFVKYSKSKEAISLVLKESQAEELAGDTPGQNTNTWLEISGGKITGEYEMISQGGKIVSMTYTKQSSGKVFNFDADSNVESSLADGCKW
jgi:hypothetical protein